MSDSLPFHESSYLNFSSSNPFSFPNPPILPSFTIFHHLLPEHYLQTPMSRHRETNPHFRLAQEQPQLQPQPQQQVPPYLQPQHESDRRQLTRQQRRRRHETSPPLLPPTPHSPQQPPPPHQAERPHTPPHQILVPYVPPVQHHTQVPHPDPDPESHPPDHRLPRHSTLPVLPGDPRHSTLPIQPRDPSSHVRMPHGRKSKPWTWLIGALCAVFWIAVILAGIVVLAVYLIFRPRGPKFDISSASLNAAYLDMGYLLNADMTLLTNFTNPSKKATVDFNYMVLNVYYGRTLIATTYVNPFREMKAESAFRNVHLVSSQVMLPLGETQRLRHQIERNRIRFEVKGHFRTRSNLGRVFRYSYWLYGHCIIDVTGPPSGVLIGKTCVTKR